MHVVCTNCCDLTVTFLVYSDVSNFEGGSGGGEPRMGGASSRFCSEVTASAMARSVGSDDGCSMRTPVGTFELE